MSTDVSQPRSVKGEQTRELILTTALRLFRENGYDATTMRVIAREAGVSVGNAYYYFASKEHLIQAFYDSLIRQHREVALPRLAGVRDLATRLRITIATHIELMQPYHAFAGGFFKTAAETYTLPGIATRRWRGRPRRFPLRLRGGGAAGSRRRRGGWWHWSAGR